MVVTCHKCKKAFRDQFVLNKHLNRKTPCDNVIKCDTCKKKFNNKQALKNHMNRKNPCKSPEEKTMCEYCGHKSSSSSNLTRHIKLYCKEKKKKDLIAQAVNNQQINTQNINNGNNNNTINGDVNISLTVNNFDKPNLSHISAEAFHKLVCDNIETVGLHKFFELCFFDPNHRENMCFHLENIARDEAFIKQDGAWILKPISKVVSQAYQQGVKNYISTTNAHREYLINKENSDGLIRKMAEYVNPPKNDTKGNIKISTIERQIQAKGYIESQMRNKKNIMKQNHDIDEETMLQQQMIIVDPE